MSTSPEMIKPNQPGSHTLLLRRQPATGRLQLNPTCSTIVETETKIWRTWQDAHGLETDRGMRIAIAAIGTGHPDDFRLEARSQEFAEFFLQFLLRMFHRFRSP